MAVTPKRFYAGKPSATLTTVYTVPTGKTAIVKNIILTNSTTNNVTIQVNLANEIVVGGYTVNAGDTIVLDLSVVLNAGDTIAVISGIASTISVFISGVEVA